MWKTITSAFTDASASDVNTSSQSTSASSVTLSDVVGLLQEHLANNRVKEAYDYLKNCENCTFEDHLRNASTSKLCKTVLDSYKQKFPTEVNDSFFEKYFPVISSVTSVNLKFKNFNEIEDCLLQYDASLHSAFELKVSKKLWAPYLTHVVADFLSLCADFLLLKLKKGKISDWRRICRLSAFCYCQILKTSDRPSLVWWRLRSSFNLIQANRMLSLIKHQFDEEGSWSKIYDSLKSPQVCKDLYAGLFSTVLSPQNVNLRSYLKEKLKPLDESIDAQAVLLKDEIENELYNEILCTNSTCSIDRIIWLLTNFWDSEYNMCIKDDNLESIDKSLNFSPQNLSSSSPAVNDLSQLDLKVFLHLSVHCATSRNERIGSKLKRYPFNITDFTVTEWQRKFWFSCRKLLKEGGNSEVRSTVADGLNFLRLKNRTHPPSQLIYSTAVYLNYEAIKYKKQNASKFVVAISDYASVYCSHLEKILSDKIHIVSKPDSPFYINATPFSQAEKDKISDICRYYTAINFILRDEYEKAVEILKKLSFNEAFYAQAGIYKKMADRIPAHDAKSDGLVEKRALLSKAQQALNSGRCAPVFDGLIAASNFCVGLSLDSLTENFCDDFSFKESSASFQNDRLADFSSSTATDDVRYPTTPVRYQTPSSNRPQSESFITPKTAIFEGDKNETTPILVRLAGSG